MHTITYYGAQTEEMNSTILIKKPCKVKSIAISPDNQIESISILDGTYLWGYDSNTNTVKNISISNMSEFENTNSQNIILYFFDNTNVALIGKQQLDKKRILVRN